MTEAVRYSDEITIRVQAGMRALIDEAARKQGMKPAAWLRQAARTGLELAGIDPAALAPRTAGALYDSLEGRQRYALVTDAGAILSMSYHAAEPEATVDDRGGVWLPVVHEDSEPFDISRHWRQAPVTRIEADRVVVTFPVIAKSLEAM